MWDGPTSSSLRIKTVTKTTLGQYFVIFGMFEANALQSSALVSTAEIHQHRSKGIGHGTLVPKIELKVFRDVMDDVNVHTEVANYVLNAPYLTTKSISSEEGILQGHAYVF
ncbi:MAG: hypothetical protein ACI88A_003581 [Paraglaciecola sp.]